MANIQKKIFLVMLGLLLVLGFAAMIASVVENTPALKKITFFNDDKEVAKIFAYIADEPAERQQGLMDKKRLSENRGMLFVFPDEQMRYFWMKDTFVPLDIIFLDKSKRIVSIAKEVPPCKNDPCPSYGSGRQSQYVIEVKGGFCDKFDIEETTKVIFH